MILVGGGKHVLYLGDHRLALALMAERCLLDGGATRHVRGQAGALQGQWRGHFLQMRPVEKKKRQQMRALVGSTYQLGARGCGEQRTRRQIVQCGLLAAFALLEGTHSGQIIAGMDNVIG